MTTAPDRIAVIALQLAQTDRRALSQAWYDALHRAQPAPPVATATRPRQAAALTAAARPAPASRERALPPARTASTAVRARTHDARPAATERREALDATARRIVRTVAALGPSRRASTHTVALDAARVTLLVRTDGGVTRLVAICAAADRERIARALAHARFALAAAGVTVAA